MPNFKFGQQVHGNVYSLADGGRAGNVAGRQRTVASCGPTSSSGSMNGGNMPGGSGGYEITRFNPAYDRLEEGSVIEDWIPRDLAGINKMLRIIYTRDAICGPAVDIMSNLPWSEFDIQGIEDDTIRKFYEDAGQLFGDKAQEMPAITTEFLVLGRFCASLIYDEAKGYWDDFVPHDSDFLTITPIPVRNFDPKLDLILSPGVRQFVNSPDYRDQAALAHLPDHLVQQMRSGQPIPLDPLNTLYLRRKTSPNDFVGTSLFTRIIPYWALEKALMNASVTAARRRAGNILHVTAGLDDRWEPSQQEMEDIAGLFIQSDEDPVGAVVVTRTGVEASEIREGGNLWKWSDEWSTFSEGKMRGLGISEALLSGDATYNNMEQARSVFTEQVRTLREYLTQQVYYRQFKILARAHGFRKRKKADLDHRTRTNQSDGKPKVKIRQHDDLRLSDLSQDDAFDIPEDDLIIPTVHWRKSLLPEGDREYLDLLEMLKEQGVPIPLRVWAARGGYDIDEAMDMLEDDVALKGRIKKWQQEVPGDEDTWGAVDDSPSSPFWDASDRFVNLRKEEAKDVLQHVVNKVHQPGKHEALADGKWLQREIHSVLKDNLKTEVMSFVIMRLGIAQNLDVSEKTIAAIAEHFTKTEGDWKKRMGELHFLSKLTGNKEPVSDVDLEKLASGTLKIIGSQNSELSKQVDTALKSEDVQPSAPTLLSGAG